MAQIKIRNLVGIGILLLLALLMGTHPGQANPPGGILGNVTVENTTANPVPTVVENTTANPVPVQLGNTTANPLPVQEAPKELVRLTPAPGVNQGFLRVKPDGTTDTIPFAVPHNKVLLVTDMNFFVGGSSGGSAQVSLFIQNLNNQAIFVFGPSAALTLSGAWGTTTVSLTTPIEVSEFGKLSYTLATSGTVTQNVVTVTGYLKPAP